MNPIIKDESLLSNISNISVMIKPNQNSSIFNFSLLNNNYEEGPSQRLCEVKIDDIFPHQQSYGHNSMLDNNSILDKLIKKQQKDCSFIPYQPQPILPQVVFPTSYNEKSWRITQQKGVSEDQAEGSQQQISVMDKPVKNQTKNIPKNYGKAIISFIEKYKNVVEEVCNEFEVPFDEFFNDMLQFKKTINTIADLRRLWIDYKYAKCMRVVSNLFFRKYSLSYIFNSRICNFRSHIKYRHRLAEAVTNPKAFKHIKEY